MAKLTEYLFYTLIFLLPWQTVFLLREIFIGGEKWQYGTIGIYLSDVILVFWIMLALYKDFFTYKQADKFQNSLAMPDLAKPDKLPVANYQLLITSFLVLWSFISILWSPDKTLAFYFSLKLLLGAGLFLVLREVKINWRRIVFVFLAAAVLQSGLGIWQFIQQDAFSSKYLGTSEHRAEQGGTSVIENETGRWLRAYGGLPHPNILGGYLTLAFLLGLITWNNMSFPRENDRGVNNLTKLLILSSLLIIFPGILLTFSRSAWLALLAGIIGLAIYDWRKKEAREKLFKIILLFGLLGMFLISAYSNLFFTRVETTRRLEQKSISERSLYFNQAKGIIKENFWLGAGAGNYTWAVFQKDEIKKPIWRYQPVHNVFALIWAELGIVGLILFLAILVLLLIKSNPQFYLLLSTFCFLLLFDHWLWTSHFGLLFFWLIAGLIMGSRKNAFGSA